MGRLRADRVFASVAAKPGVSNCPAPHSQRSVRLADALLGPTRPVGLLLDRGFVGRDWAADHAARGTQVVLAHSRADRHELEGALLRLDAGAAISYIRYMFDSRAGVLLVLPQALYRTDGTAAGTTLLSPADLSDLTEPVVAQGAAYFFASQGGERALWRAGTESRRG